MNLAILSFTTARGVSFRTTGILNGYDPDATNVAATRPPLVCYFTRSSHVSI